MSEPSDPNFWHSVAGWAGAVISSLIGYIVHGHNEKIKDMQKAIDSKADDNELTRQRGNIDKLFDGQRQIEQTMAKGFSDIKDDLHEKYDDLKTIIMDLRK